MQQLKTWVLCPFNLVCFKTLPVLALLFTFIFLVISALIKEHHVERTNYIDKASLKVSDHVRVLQCHSTLDIYR